MHFELDRGERMIDRLEDGCSTHRFIVTGFFIKYIESISDNFLSPTHPASLYLRKLLLIASLIKTALVIFRVLLKNRKDFIVLPRGWNNRYPVKCGFLYVRAPIVVAFLFEKEKLPLSYLKEGIDPFSVAIRTVEIRLNVVWHVL